MTKRRAVGLAGVGWVAFTGMSVLASAAEQCHWSTTAQVPVVIWTILTGVCSLVGTVVTLVTWPDLKETPCGRCARLEAENAQLLEAVR